MTKVLVLGASGMLGNAVMRTLSSDTAFDVYGSVRSDRAAALLPTSLRDRIVAGIDVLSEDDRTRLFAQVRPDVVINCVGLIKQQQAAVDPLAALPLNALLPHRLARLCAAAGARLIHMSTDCVFSGAIGNYREDDACDAYDLYGRSKHMGEVDAANAITLRTSIIGHELGGGAHGLVGWLLAQTGAVKGYRRAVFSGLPTVELARIIGEHVIPRPDMRGVWHVSAEPISKCELLRLVASTYGKAIEIVPDDELEIDRSLDSRRFREVTGYSSPPWPALVAAMHEFG